MAAKRERRVFLEATLEPSRRLSLDQERSAYLCRVLRLERGARLRVFNGDGDEYRAAITRADRRRCEIEIIERIHREPPPLRRLHLLQSLIKGDRLDRVLQKATELGATDLWLVSSARSEVRLGPERVSRRLRHWRAVIEDACEQCGRARLPALHAPRPLSETLAAVSVEALLLLAPGAEPLAGPPEGDVGLLVGPEGGFVDHERRLVEAAGARPMGLGGWTLRADTAPLAGLVVLRQAWQWRLP